MRTTCPEAVGVSRALGTPPKHKPNSQLQPHLCCYTLPAAWRAERQSWGTLCHPPGACGWVTSSLPGKRLSNFFWRLKVKVSQPMLEASRPCQK